MAKNIVKQNIETTTPTVSVVMSVFNCEKYIAEAVESILNQTFTDFEFIIIDDGSTDCTLSIIEEYKDSRIVLISRENKGLVASLNEGISVARGKYIARMDGDDISDVTRLAVQHDFMRENQDCVLVGSCIRLIDGRGEYTGIWPADADTQSRDDIRSVLPIENCMAHPTFFARTDVLKRYPYDHSQVAGEDYDLLLRMLADGLYIGKTPLILLSYRVHRESITQVSNRGSAFTKVAKLKLRFTLKRLLRLKFGVVEQRVVRSLLGTTKRNIREKLLAIVKAPFRLLLDYQNVFGTRDWEKGLKGEPSGKHILFLLPWLTMGGADKVVIDLIKGLAKDKYSVSVLTTNSEHLNSWSSRLDGHILDMVDLTRFARTANIPRLIGRYCEKRGVDTVIVSNTLLGYKALPHIKRAKVIDIVHGQSGWLDQGGSPAYSLPYAGYIDKRVVVTSYMKDYLIANYDIAEGSIEVIHNGIDTKHFYTKRTSGKRQCVVGWVGRFSAEKRPGLFVEAVARITQEQKSTFKDYHFYMAGDGPAYDQIKTTIMEKRLDGHIRLLGAVDDMASLLRRTDIVVMTSEMEGLPMALLEAQSAGLPIVAMAVGGIPEIVSSQSGALISPFESDIPGMLAKEIQRLRNDSNLTARMSKVATKNANERFSVQRMIESYEDII